ncbi:MAG TPA: LysM peptidoglycan-binding domain-containing protein [Spirochaetia bacterium]|nr:LysM peptidoglycan-binding domain-containing protein [Spirochaetia bacterium]
MNAQKQRKNTAAAVVIIVLILLVVLGIGLYFVFSKPAAPVATPTPTPVETPAATPTPEATPTPAPATKLLGTHTVIPKDTLWWISDKWYKDPVLWPSIYEINKAEIKDPDLIFPGQKFDIPALTGTATNLADDDKTLLSQGYLEAYRVYKEKGKKDAEDYKTIGDKLAPKK